MRSLYKWEEGIYVSPKGNVSFAQAMADMLDSPKKGLYTGLEWANRMRTRFDETSMLSCTEEAYITLLFP